MRMIPIALSSILLGLTVQAEEAIFTNRWTAASGGSWTDAANWQHPEMIGTNDATRAFFDLSGLPSGERIGVPRVEGGVQAYGLKVGSASGTVEDTWLLQAEGNYDWQDPCLKFCSQPDPIGVAVVEVGSGLLRIDGKLAGGVTVAKTGAGALRPVRGDNKVDFRMIEGTIDVIGDEVLMASGLNFYEPGARLTHADYQRQFFVAWIDSSEGRGTPIELDGRHIRFNGHRRDATLAHDLLAGAGTVSASSGCALSIEEIQSGFTGTYRLGMGDLVFQSRELRGLYCFENAEEPGAASSFGTKLTAVGSVAVERDEARGSVLKLDGSSHLAAPDPKKLPEGFCTGTGEFTVACWLRIAEGCDGEATVFYMGKWETGGGCNLLRLAVAAGDGKKGVMYTNYGNNRFVRNDLSHTLYDGGWHHLALTHAANGRGQLWIDGVKAAPHTGLSRRPGR